MSKFISDPRLGSLAWPLATAFFVYNGSIYAAVFSAFWGGVSLQRWLNAEAPDLNEGGGNA
jgi:hypothetical protein